MAFKDYETEKKGAITYLVSADGNYASPGFHDFEVETTVGPDGQPQENVFGVLGAMRRALHPDESGIYRAEPEEGDDEKLSGSLEVPQRETSPSHSDSKGYDYFHDAKGDLILEAVYADPVGHLLDSRKAQARAASQKE